MHGWINLYKQTGISSAKVLNIIKRSFKGAKVGHSGTLDVEAEGVLPVGIGAATKLIQFVQDGMKEYKFTVQFGATTSTGDAAGEITNTVEYCPTEQQCLEICKLFLGKVQQTPPAYSAMKIGGVRAYKLARENKEFSIPSRIISIYSLECLNYEKNLKQATFNVQCSKGTYVRTLAEDISLSLQSLGYVVELARLRCGPFVSDNSLDASTLMAMDAGKAATLLRANILGVEAVLDGIPVLDVSSDMAYDIICGKKCFFSDVQNANIIWLRCDNKIIAFGRMVDGLFVSSRVIIFN